MNIQSINQQNNNNTSFKAILYPGKYSGLMNHQIERKLPDTFIELNPKYIETKGKGLFTLVKKYLKGNQAKYIIKENENRYSGGGYVYNMDKNLWVHCLYKDEANRRIPAVEEEKAVVKGMKEQLLAKTETKDMSDEEFFQKYGIKYFKSEDY